MRYIICYKLRRKNARRKEILRTDFENDKEAINFFSNTCKVRDERRDYELLTGDWKHIAYYTKDGLNIEPILPKNFTPIEKYKGGKEIIRLYFGMTESMQKAVKDIMIVANGGEIEE